MSEFRRLLLLPAGRVQLRHPGRGGHAAGGLQLPALLLLHGLVSQHLPDRPPAEGRVLSRPLLAGEGKAGLAIGRGRFRDQ